MPSQDSTRIILLHKTYLHMNSNEIRELKIFIHTTDRINTQLQKVLNLRKKKRATYGRDEALEVGGDEVC